jgi:hypothetical protein
MDCTFRHFFEGSDFSPVVFDLSSVRDNEVHAKSLDGHTAIHHGGKQEGTVFVDGVPVPSNKS